VAVCKTAMRLVHAQDPESSRPECASANGFANETGRNRGDDVRHRRRSVRPSPGQRDAPETGETRVVWLITQRSRVQIPPPLPRPEAGPENGSGLWLVRANGLVQGGRLPRLTLSLIFGHTFDYDRASPG
jgi:hypothetical protein